MWQISSPLRHLILYLCRAVHLPLGNLMSSQKFRQIRFPRSKVCHMQNLSDRCNEDMGRITAMMVAVIQNHKIFSKKVQNHMMIVNMQEKLLCLLETNNTIYMWVR